MTTCCDYTPHDAVEPCLFEGCTSCGASYAMGPSAFDTCGSCARAPTSEPLSAAVSRLVVLIQPVDRPEEEPF